MIATAPFGVDENALCGMHVLLHPHCFYSVSVLLAFGRAMSKIRSTSK